MQHCQRNKANKQTKGHHLLLGDYLNSLVKIYVKSLRDARAFINSAIVDAAADGIV